MCTVTIDPAISSKTNYYLFNIIANKKPVYFTVDDVFEFSSNYSLSVSKQETYEIIKNWLSNGIIKKTSCKKYSVIL